MKIETKRDYRQEHVDKLVEKMEEAVKYEKPWITGGLPYNPESGTVYSGSNYICLLMEGRDDDRWMTAVQIKKQAEKDGVNYYIRRGEKATFIQYPAPISAKDENGQILKDNDGKTVQARDENGNAKITMKFFPVFNAEQIENYPPLMKNEKPFVDYKPAEMLLDAMKETGLQIEHRNSGGAYYSPSQDKIVLPQKEQFKSEAHYYATALHEAGHATGHPSRLNRDHTGSRISGDKEALHKYAFEELVAEISSYMVGGQIGVPYDSSTHENHAVYVNSWIAGLKDKTTGKEFFAKACNLAGKSADFQITKLHEKILEAEKVQGKDAEKVVIQGIAVQPEKAVERIPVAPVVKKPEKEFVRSM